MSLPWCAQLFPCHPPPAGAARRHVSEYGLEEAFRRVARGEPSAEAPSTWRHLYPKLLEQLDARDKKAGGKHPFTTLIDKWLEHGRLDLPGVSQETLRRRVESYRDKACRIIVGWEFIPPPAGCASSSYR